MASTRIFAASALSVLTTVALAAVLLLGVTSPSNAQSETSCPAGSVPNADGTACVSQPADTGDAGGGVDENITTTTSCVQGVLSDDGKYCIVPRLDAAPATTAGSGASTEAPVPVFTG